MKNDWHNNLISKRLDEEYPHDFSICDIDGVTRVFYKAKNGYKNRLIIYESKHKNEPASQQQLETLFLLNDIIDWSKLDSRSGLYLITHDESATHLEKCKITRTFDKGSNKYRYGYDTVDHTTIDNFYKLVSAQDKR